MSGFKRFTESSARSAETGRVSWLHLDQRSGSKLICPVPEPCISVLVGQTAPVAQFELQLVLFERD